QIEVAKTLVRWNRNGDSCAYSRAGTAAVVRIVRITKRQTRTRSVAAGDVDLHRRTSRRYGRRQPHVVPLTNTGCRFNRRVVVVDSEWWQCRRQYCNHRRRDAQERAAGRLDLDLAVSELTQSRSGHN